MLYCATGVKFDQLMLSGKCVRDEAGDCHMVLVFAFLLDVRMLNKRFPELNLFGPGIQSAPIMANSLLTYLRS